MEEISVVTNRPYGNSKDYLPLLYVLGEHLCHAYGLGFSRKYHFSDEPLEKMTTPNSPKYLRYLIARACKVFKLPRYYTYMSGVLMLDKMFAKKVAGDNSRIVLSSPLMSDTIAACKKAGKTVVSVAENSEPIREYQRISGDYEKFKIRHKYIYGDRKWQERVDSGLRNSDYIISISDVSQRTFQEAGYDMSKFKLIPKTGSTMQPFIAGIDGKPKAFITTAFHCFIKGTHRLLLAWKKANIKDIPLIIVGNLCEDMAEFVEKYGPFDNVVFEGHRSDLSTWYQQWNAVGILMSLSEGGSKVIAEMMSYGFPMLVSPDATCDMVEGEKTRE